MTTKQDLIQAIEQLPEDSLNDVLNYVRSRFTFKAPSHSSAHTTSEVPTSEVATVAQLLEVIRRDRESLPAQANWLDSTALIREDRDR